MRGGVKTLQELLEQVERPPKLGERSCYGCKHLRKETESWEMPHIWWWECTPRPAAPNLKSFPFANTKCKAWERT